MAPRLIAAAQNAAADGVVDLVDLGAGTNGSLQLRTGARPAAITDPAAGTLLATFTLPAPAFGAAASGVATAQGLPLTTTGDADGDVGHFRVLDQDGNVVWDNDSVGTTGTDLVLNTVTISIGVDVEITAWTVTMPAG